MFDRSNLRKTMRAAKKKRRQAAGWKFGTADQFLGLAAAESSYLDALFARLKWRKTRRKL
jgi:hypothetical protein